MRAARLLPALALGGLASLGHAADDAARPEPRVYAFQAFLDGKPIGMHRFTVTGDGRSRKVTSEADFAVKFIGITAYRYRHHADEQWAGDCLATLASHTDDDGKPSGVKLSKTGDVNEIASSSARKSEPGCLMSYAYWNPAMREQKRLLNPQTGQVDAVKVERVGSGSVPVGGREVAATDWRITGGDAPIDLWISEQGDWIGLDSTVSKGSHKLTYRLP